MSKEGDKASVFRTTKVRTKLKGDSSWLQRCNETQAEAEEEVKPWLAEVRASRLNGAPVETSPVSSPTTSTVPPTKSDTERNVFTKLDKPVSSSTSNGFSGTTQFTKKPSESYKKIAPYTVRPASENQEGQLSHEEQEKRKEAASNVLNKSAVRKRSYVLSAAKKFESKEEASDTSLVNSSPSFVAKRVEITDDDESAATPAPASTPLPSSVVSVTSVAPEPKPQKIVDSSVKATDDVAVKEMVAPKVEEAALKPVKQDPPPVSVAEKEPFKDMKPACTNVATPLPKLIPERVQAVCTEPEPEEKVSGKVDTPLVKLTPASPPPISPTPASPALASAVPESPAPVPPTPAAPAPVSPEPKPQKIVDSSVKATDDVAVKETVAPKVEEAALKPVKQDLPPVSVAEKEPFNDMKPACTNVATPLPKLIPERVQAVCTEPEPEEKVSGKVDTPLVKLTPASPTPISPTPASPAPASAVPESPAPVPPTPAAPAPVSPEPKPQKIVDSSVKATDDVAVKEMVAPKVEEAALKPVKQDLPPVSVAEKEPFNDMKPACTNVATPLPKLIPERVQAVCTEPEPEEKVSGKVDTPLVKLTPASPPPISPTPASPAPAVPESPAPVPPTPAAPAPVSTVPLSPAPVSAVTEITVKTEPKPSPKPSSSVDTLTALSNALISFDTSSTSFKNDEPVLAKEKGGSVDSHTTEDGVKREPAPALSNSVQITDDLLALTDGQEESADPVPPSPGHWSQDLLSGLDSESNPTKTSSTLNLRANDVFVSNTEARSLSTQREEEKQTDATAKKTQSSTETVTITTKTVIITDKSEEDNAHPWSSHVTTTVTESSSADPFDPYPIGTTSPNSSSDLLQPLSDISINSAPPTTKIKDPSPETNMSGNALESLADDVIPITTDRTSLSTRRSWAHTWEISTPQQANTEESQGAEPGGRAEDQNTLVMFERKSIENDSPWDRWTSPTIYTNITTTGEEEEEEEESPEDTQTETVTTITTIREIHSEPEPAMDRYETYFRTVTEEDQCVQTPEPETKKGFVYVKEYVNATELSLHNARDTIDGVSDYLTSSSASYSYSSPSTYSSSMPSSCTFCGELVGNDSKIFIEHLNINCHPACFKCGVCSKPMGDLLDGMFIHGGKVHCESCYSKALD
ncbi:zinc finger protein 185 isoform X2 [Siniperca chuatsi]|uniref:zinc finger protein 185 isoform X2 n=1 Tax=Siniperca chuatsi TaxID=119488 RepID=UPI001CE21BAC|nr:zinc finger protein 185 isoform X2 [Siniperca chuatsi]